MLNYYTIDKKDGVRHAAHEDDLHILCGEEIGNGRPIQSVYINTQITCDMCRAVYQILTPTLAIIQGV